MEISNLIKASKELSIGVFWDIDGELFAYPFYEDAVDGVAKLRSGGRLSTQ